MTKLNETGCFVFPAFNSSYKTRKRTFQCCRTCRNKRIKCIILSFDYEVSGCDNCRTLGVPCELIKSENGLNRGSGDVKRLKTELKLIDITNASLPMESTSKSGLWNGQIPVGTPMSISPDTVIRSLGNVPSTTQLNCSTQLGTFNALQLGLAVSQPYHPPQFSTHGIVPRAFGAPPVPNLKIEASNEIVVPGTDVADMKFRSPVAQISAYESSYSSFPFQRHILGPEHTNPLFNSSALLDPSAHQNCSTAPKKTTFVAYQTPGPNTYPNQLSSDPQIPKGLDPKTLITQNSKVSDLASSRSVSTAPYNDYGIEILKEPLMNYSFNWNNLDFVDDIINKVDHHFLKYHFDFNTTLPCIKVTFKAYRASDRMPSKDLIDGKKVKKDQVEYGDFGDAVIKKDDLSSNTFLTELHLDQFKFLLCISAFTLNTPGFCVISPEDLKKLFEIYFYKVNSIFPMVFEEEFWELYSRNRIPNVMLYAVVLNAARDELAEPILARSFVNQNVEFSRNFASFVTKLEMKIRQLLVFLPELSDTEKLTRLVTQLLLAHCFKYNKFGSEQSSGDTTDCIGYAHSLAIHQDFFHQKIVHTGAIKKAIYLKRLWWVLFIFDRFNGILNGKAFFIRRLDFNIDPPSDSSLNKLVRLAYRLEDTAIAIYRTKRKTDGESAQIQPDKAPGDPAYNPKEIIENELKVLNDPDRNSKLSVTDAISEDSHLPNLSIDLYRDRMIYFLERLVNFWVILILRLSQIKATNGNFEQDDFLNLLNKRIFESFKALKAGYCHKLVITTPVIPLVLLSAFSSPIKAQMFGRRRLVVGAKKGQPVESFKITESYKKELSYFSNKWWFIKEVLRTFEQLEQQVQTSKDNAPLATHTRKPKNDKISIGLLLSAVNDAETFLPLQLSIASPGFYEEIIVKEEEDEAVEAEKPEKPSQEQNTGEDDAFQSVDAWSRGPELESIALGADIDDTNAMKLLLASEVNFDISDIAEMVNLEMSFIPTAMDFFNVPHQFI